MLIRRKGKCGVFAGNSVWSTSERLVVELLTIGAIQVHFLSFSFSFGRLRVVEGVREIVLGRQTSNCISWRWRSYVFSRWRGTCSRFRSAERRRRCLRLDNGRTSASTVAGYEVRWGLELVFRSYAPEYNLFVEIVTPLFIQLLDMRLPKHTTTKPH